MAEANSIKAAVRARDGSRCVECGMTEREHRENFGRNLQVHRLEEGADYAQTECVALCALAPPFPHGGKVLSAAFSPDGKRVWTAD
jgi:hypothetical protein